MKSKDISKFNTLSKKYRKLTVEPKTGLKCGSETLFKPFLLQPILSTIFGEKLLFSDNMILYLSMLPL
jgi:hypothetical protein